MSSLRIGYPASKKTVDSENCSERSHSPVDDSDLDEDWKDDELKKHSGVIAASGLGYWPNRHPGLS